VASIFWVVSLVGLAAAALSFWGILVPVDAWRQLAIVSSIVSTLGIVLFLGTRHTFNTVAALGDERGGPRHPAVATLAHASDGRRVGIAADTP
jgi:hypothetical protein